MRRSMPNRHRGVEMHSIYDNFLNYLSTCQGCINPRQSSLCRFRGACANAESLAQKGIVSNPEELKFYSRINRNGYKVAEYALAKNLYRGDVGHCSYEVERD